MANRCHEFLQRRLEVGIAPARARRGVVDRGEDNLQLGLGKHFRVDKADQDRGDRRSRSNIHGDFLLSALARAHDSRKTIAVQFAVAA